MSSAWNSIGNWSPAQIPTASDAVIIPSTTTNDPVIPTSYAALASSITIQTGGKLTLSDNGSISAGGLIIEVGGELVTADQSETTITLTSTLENHGTISSRGQLVILAAASTNDGTIICSGNYPSFTPIITFMTPFNNAGTVDIQNGHVDLPYGGTHTGTFTGSTSNTGSWAGLWVGSETVSGQTFTFLAESAITLPRLVTDGDAVVNIFGTYAPAGASELRIWGTSTVTFDLPVDGNVNVMADDVAVASTLYLNGSDGFTFSELSIWPNAYLIFNDATSITGNFYWNGGTITGNGTTTIEASAEPVYIQDGTTQHILNGHTLTNKAEADWTIGNVVLTNNAVIINDGIFNALGTYSMTGTANESFTNNGSFVKDNLGTTTTTTTVDIPFTNNGTVSIVAGNLNFLQGIDNGENAVINLGDGTLNPGDTLDLASDDSLIGSGTLAANLVSSGTVSPGNSAGSITVQGDYTQSADGILEIELGGTGAGTEYDQLIVTGTATMAGTLNVSLINGFIPQVGDSFTILPYGTRSGGFSTLNLPEGYRWGIGYGYSGLTLSVLEGGSISGIVTCNSPHTVFVDLWVDDYNSPPPQDSINIACGESYSFTNLPDGTYYVGAWIDLNESGDGPPDPGEPYAWYGDPTAITIVDGEIKENIDISIEGGYSTIYLPLILR